jgi:hypothetical protein
MRKATPLILLVVFITRGSFPSGNLQEHGTPDSNVNGNYEAGTLDTEKLLEFDKENISLIFSELLPV